MHPQIPGGKTTMVIKFILLPVYLLSETGDVEGLQSQNTNCHL